MALGTVSKVIRQWDVATGGRVSAQTEGHSSVVHSVTYSPDGRTIATAGSNQEIFLWDADQGRQRTKLNSPTSADVVAYNRRGDRLATSRESNGILRIWNPITGEKTLEIDTSHKKVRQIAFLPTEPHVVSISADTDWVWSARHEATETVDVWNINSGEKVNSFSFTGPSTESVAVLNSGDEIALGAADGSMRVFNLQTGELNHRLQEHQDSLDSMALSTDGGTLVTGGRDGLIRVWDTATWKVLGILDPGLPISSVAISPDKKRIVSCATRELFQAWDTETRRPLRVFECAADGNSVSISPDGTRFVVGLEDGGVYVYPMP